MSTPHISITSRTRLFIPLIILSDSKDEDTTLPVVSAPSLDRVSTLFGYSPDSDLDSEPTEDDSSDEDMIETAESPQTRTALTSFVQPPLVRQSPSATSPSLPPPSVLPSSSHKRSRSPSPPLSLVSPPPPPPPPVALVALMLVLPMDELSPERIESVEDDVETLRARLAYAEYENVALRVKVETLEQHNEVTRDLLKIAKGRITLLQLRAVAAEQQDVEALHARAEAVEQRAEALQASLRAAHMDMADL
ncbi:hypothetical protein Tco_0887483 [Tanacetum coccineum]